MHTALAFVSLNLRNEWLVLGRAATVAIRGLPQFGQIDSIYCYPTNFTFIGKLGCVFVYTTDTLPTNEWLAGVMHAESKSDVKLCCRGVIANDHRAEYVSPNWLTGQPRH